MFGVKRLAVLVVLALSAVVAQAQTPPREVVEQKASFMSAGRPIRLEVFAPKGKDRVPAILLVPESKSMNEVGFVYRGAARLLAERGYLVALVHFFDSTGHRGVDPNDIKEKDFRAWKDTVADAYCHVRDKLDPKRVKKEEVGMLGTSLGGFLALSVSMDKELKVKAVASYFGGIPDKLWSTLEHLPPTLVIHGRKDKIVCWRESLAVDRVCELFGIPHECKIYDDGHMFEKSLKAYALKVLFEHLSGKRKGKFDASAAVVEGLQKEPTVHDAVERGLAFFDKHLKGKAAAKAKPGVGKSDATPGASKSDAKPAAKEAAPSAPSRSAWDPAPEIIWPAQDYAGSTRAPLLRRWRGRR